MSFVLRYPEDLPITVRRREIVETIRNHQVLILAGETGSGKTTQLPKMCLEALGEESPGQIGCTQPRRVAAMSVSKRVAEELQVSWGGLVGCKMRFSDATRRDTKVKFMTDGILLAEIQSDPMLRAYSALILDEAHERSLNIDFLLGYLKQLLPKRPDLKVMVTSATIDTAAFSRHFGVAPIIEVSGRLYPVDIRYRPVAETDDEPHYVDAAIAATEEVLAETEQGDVLVFMPTEQDIRETADVLSGHLGSRVEVLTLFGRMAAAEQQRVFSPGQKRRVIVSTNVAETSVTLPRIRYVIDSGLARMSRYNPRTRTKRLPVEGVSQSSANQRAGRAGRLSDGVCVRLYDEEDFGKRPEFTMPEIQRSNLAEVILRMKAFRLGDIEEFPFLEPPHSAAIRSGYQLLHELGALSDVNELTPMGRELAGLPLDPSLGRMLVQAVREGCVDEMLVLAAGLSIPDPRERPEEKKELANAAHKAFAVPESDFITLLKIWEAGPVGERRSKNELRKFCRRNFLSFTRMNEWGDLWRQLCQLDWAKRVPNEKPKVERPKDDAIHRCILAAQLGHIGKREARNVYKTAGSREAMVFPGSNLYERREKTGKGGVEKTNQPLWIVAGEVVQTSQLFARMVAKIDPQWAAELGAHLCEYRYSEPHWSAKSGRVLVTRRALLHGLEVDRKKIDYGKIDSQGATQIFIRGALVEPESVMPQRFHQHNQKLRQKIETTLTRVRSNKVYELEERVFEFYNERIEGVSSIHDLNALIKEHGDAFLHATEEDLTQGEELKENLQLFPDQVTLGNSVLPVSYHYRPGEEEDGVSVQVPLEVAEHLTSGQIQWMVPGLREEQCKSLLRALPRVVRRQLMPIEAKAEEMARQFDPGKADFMLAFAQHLRSHYGAEVRVEDWPPDSLPLHLRPRIEVLDPKKRAVLSTRDLGEIKREAEKNEVRSDTWEKAVPRLERYSVAGWTFGDLPERVLIEEVGGRAVYGYQGLALRDGEVDVRLYRTAAEAVKESPAAIRRLLELALGKDLAWLAKELRHFGEVSSKPKTAVSLASALDQLGAMNRAAGPMVVKATQGLPDQAQEHVLRHLLKMEPLMPMTESRFEARCEAVRRELPLIAQRTRDFYAQVQSLKREIAGGTHRFPGMDDDLARLVPADLLAVTPHEQMTHVLRYLKAVKVRAERAYNQPAKDAQKAEVLAEFDGWESYVPAANCETFRWLMEEYRVQIFAQELGTAQPVSVKRLEALL